MYNIFSKFMSWQWWYGLVMWGIARWNWFLHVCCPICKEKIQIYLHKLLIFQVVTETSWRSTWLPYSVVLLTSVLAQDVSLCPLCQKQWQWHPCAPLLRWYRLWTGCTYALLQWTKSFCTNTTTVWRSFFYERSGSGLTLTLMLLRRVRAAFLMGPSMALMTSV